MRIIVDSGFWFGFIDQTDGCHGEALDIYEKIMEMNPVFLIAPIEESLFWMENKILPKFGGIIRYFGKIFWLFWRIIQANFALSIRTNHQMLQPCRNRHHLRQIRIDLMVYKNL